MGWSARVVTGAAASWAVVLYGKARVQMAAATMVGRIRWCIRWVISYGPFDFLFVNQPDTRARKTWLCDFGKGSGKVATRISLGRGRAVSSVRHYVETADNFVTIEMGFFLEGGVSLRVGSAGRLLEGPKTPVRGGDLAAGDGLQSGIGLCL
jgi:hypothetical protein